MSDMPQQSVPVIIKTGVTKTSTPIRIEAYDQFQITTAFGPNADDWIESTSQYAVAYIESVVLGSNQQFCQTSKMEHPLTLTFKDDGNNDIFKISEVEISGSQNFNLVAAVDQSGAYFQADNSSSWTQSTFDPPNAEIYLVEVTDATNTPVCQLIKMSNNDAFILNLEAPV